MIEAEDIRQIISEEPLDLDKILGLVQTVTTVPTFTPVKFIDQIKLYYVSGANAYLYFYDNTNNSWKSATLS